MILTVSNEQGSDKRPAAEQRPAADAVSAALSLLFESKAMLLSPTDEHKSFEVPPLDQPHSAPRADPHPINSPELGAGFEASTHPYLHDTRASDSERTKMSSSTCQLLMARNAGPIVMQFYRMCFQGYLLLLGFTPPFLACEVRRELKGMTVRTEQGC